MNAYIQKLQRAVESAGTNLCIGLDPDPARMPEQFRNIADPAVQLTSFCKSVIDLTAEFACAFKPNLAFFEALGKDAFVAFDEIVRHIGTQKIIVADAKRGDIGNTGLQYKKAFFDVLNVDALTVNPWMGLETLTPYLDAPGKAIYVLVLTSNPGAEDFMFPGRILHNAPALRLASALEELQTRSKTHIGMVLGATRPERMGALLQTFPASSVLVPGFGAQGGDPDSVRNLLAQQQAPALFNVSRDILFAEESGHSWEVSVKNSAARWSKALSMEYHAG